MTREETIRKVLDTALWTRNASDDNKGILTNALIKALEGEHCEDAISRQAVLDMVEDTTDQFGNKHRVVTEGMISLLPPVIPKPKTEKVVKMRDVTPEERESIAKYIKSISKPTGVGFENLEQEPFINKLCVSEKSCEHDKNVVLDKIKAEIKEESRFCPLTEGLERALEIIDKYTAESEDEKC